MNSYQKLKAENAKLLSDIRTLVMEESFVETNEVKNRYKLKFGFANVALQGKRDMNTIQGYTIGSEIKDGDTILFQLLPDEIKERATMGVFTPKEIKMTNFLPGYFWGTVDIPEEYQSHFNGAKYRKFIISQYFVR